jgi:8-amino-7-oxononanoate synthase
MHSELSSGQTRPFLAGRRIQGTVSARIRIDGREFVNFFGSGYLALGTLPEVRTSIQRALDGGCALSQQLPAALCAIEAPFEEVEAAIASACGTESSVYFASGYLTGAVAIASLDKPYDVIFIDEGAHYNLLDAARSIEKPVRFFRHADPNSFRELARKVLRPGQRPLLMTDGIFPTTGRLSPLADYAQILEDYDGQMIVDEAHAFGVVGPQGRGAAEHHNVSHCTTIGSTLSKAYCAHGGFIACSSLAAHQARTRPPVRGANAGSPLLAAAAAGALKYAASHPEIRDTLRHRAAYLRTRLRAKGIDIIESPAPIVSFQYGNRSDMKQLQERAFNQGVHLYHSDYLGAGPDGIIRCAVFRDHSDEDIDALIGLLR